MSHSLFSPRRRWLACALLPLCALSLAPWQVRADTTEPIVLEQTVALTGPLGDLGQEFSRGAKVYFDALNARGGVQGRSVKLVVHDDAYDPKKTVEIAQGVIANASAFAFFGSFGTANNEALIPLAQSAGMPVITPYTGANSVRAKSLSGVFNLRASYADEVERSVEHLATVGIQRLAVIHQNNAFGKEYLAAAHAAMEKRGLKPVLVASVENDASDVNAVAEKAAGSSAEAVLLGLAGKPAIEAIKGISQRRRGLTLYGLSVLGTASNIKALGSAGTGVAITQVVPFPTNPALPLVREYQQAMTAAGFTDFSHQSLEGYANAKLAAEGLRRAGKNLSRSSFVAAMEEMRGLNLGGVTVSFGQGAASGSKFVELTLIGSQGRLIK
ncbi:ABC transporter substrate-binding protein [Curvibacter sp. APW13]|uniref:ABC transporter substrate-binding protein n=1 Tax=Curvibacter sp. APW13 TaxID=3077236 RepID=UPI0028DE1B31|nr:ABC transporter substrate-binding protein [Curvibacter sp. APW13]MDT8989307.1 ABC transporter substrate-binding protein [Curvibacter sp. APW13]